MLKDNLSTLNEHISRLVKDEGNRVINSSLINHLKGLRAILQMLLAQVPNQHGKEIINSYMDFNDAFNLYMAYSDTASSLSLDIKHEKKRFKELICHRDYGLCVYIIMDSFVVLRSDNVDMEHFIEDFISLLSERDTSEDRLSLDANLCTDLLNSMDSEWDKNIVRVLIGSSRSRKEIAKLGIDSHNIAILTDKVLSIVNERKNAELAATDMVKLRLEEQIKNVDCRINQKEKMIKQKSLDWEKFQLEELGEEIDSLKERKKIWKTLKIL